MSCPLALTRPPPTESLIQPVSIMRDLFANASEFERHLSRVAADVWGCAPYTDTDGTRYPLAASIMGITTAFHPGNRLGIHAVQVLGFPSDLTPDEHDNPPATVLHSMYATAPAPMPWRHACEQVHALVQHECPLPFEGNEPIDVQIAFQHALTDQIAFYDGDGLRVDILRFMNEDNEPTAGPPFWNVVVWVDEKPVANMEIPRPNLMHARAAALREYNTFKGTAPAIRRFADAQGWGAVMRFFEVS